MALVGWGVLPLCKDAVGVFTVPADRTANKLVKERINQWVSGLKLYELK